MRSPHLRVSLRRLTIVMALIGLVMALARALFFQGTIYAVGYSESRFRQVRAGMTSEEVEALMGPPLRRTPWPRDGFANWSYSAKRPGHSDYWRRDVFMKDDRVVDVVRTYWID